MKMKKKNGNKIEKQFNIEVTRRWKVIFYETEAGKCPMQNYIDTLSMNDRNHLLQRIEELRIIGNNIRRPKGDKLRDKIYELRVALENFNTRALYFFCFENNIVITHAFNKKTNKVPESEINKAIKYRNDYLQRKLNK